MADNYLERRMEEYERARRGANAPRRVASSLRPGQVVIDYPPMRLLVTGANTPAGRAVIEAFRRFNCRVAITCADRHEGSRLAQHTGAQFHPGDLADAIDRLTAAGDPVAFVVDLDGSMPAGTTIPILVPPAAAQAAGPAAIASWALFVAHPANAWARE